nr:MAG TPA: hypothetical protein [Bacteriophage sp.]
MQWLKTQAAAAAVTARKSGLRPLPRAEGRTSRIRQVVPLCRRRVGLRADFTACRGGAVQERARQVRQGAADGAGVRPCRLPHRLHAQGSRNARRVHQRRAGRHQAAVESQPYR